MGYTKRKEVSWKKGRREEARSERKRREANPNPNPNRVAKGNERQEQSQTPFYPKVLLHMPNPVPFHSHMILVSQPTKIKKSSLTPKEKSRRKSQRKFPAAEPSRCKESQEGKSFPLQDTS
jgi:hypothetical protein